MAVRFKKPFNVLIDDLARGGYAVRSVTNIPDSRGRSADVLLVNGVIVSWDPHTQSIWTEGPHQLGHRVENFLHTIYERGWPPRWFVLQRSRLRARRNATSIVEDK